MAHGKLLSFVFQHGSADEKIVPQGGEQNNMTMEGKMRRMGEKRREKEERE